MVAQGSAGQGTQGQGRGEGGGGGRAGQGSRAHRAQGRAGGQGRALLEAQIFNFIHRLHTHIQSLPTAAQINTDALAFLFHTEALLQEHTDTRL